MLLIGEHFDFNQPAEGQFLNRHAGTGGRILGGLVEIEVLAVV